MGFVDPAYDWDVFGQLHRETGIVHGLTRVWLLNAWWSVIQGGRLPMKRPAPSQRFDLFDWEASYFDDLARYVATMNKHGLVPILTFLTVYEWAERGRRPDVPDPDKGPFRFNTNGVRWGDPDDVTFGAPPNDAMLPDRWLKDFIRKVCERVRGYVVVYETGQEMPEKDMHWRIAKEIRRHDTTNRIMCNRQEDTPGQPFNMEIGGNKNLDMIAFHNWCSPAVLDVDHPDEAPVGRPRTMRSLIDGGRFDPKRIIMSTDGCRLSGAYFTQQMRELMLWAWAKRISVEWQSPAKRAFFTGGAPLSDYGDLRKYLDVGALAQIGAL